MQDTKEQRILDLIDHHSHRIYDFCNDIYSNGEQGFHEFRTAGKFEDFLNSLNIHTKNKIALTGVTGEIGNTDGPVIGLIGELDGIACPAHPNANPENGVSHSCGHHIQMGAVLGAAIALSDPDILKEMKGRIRFMGIPAEEYIDADEKERLTKEEGIRYSSSGKSEFIRIGEFDDIDMVLTHHVHMTDTDKDVLLGSSSTNGFISKKTIYRGKASHAANAPELGINALNAAMIGLNAASYQRETFKDSDAVRVHSIINKGGGAVNVVPDYAEIETMVRAKTLHAIQDANNKTNMAFQAGAHALGAQVTILDYPGYLPVLPRKAEKAMLSAVNALTGEVSFEETDTSKHSGASTDVGDLAHLMPVLNFTTGGFGGSLHSADFSIEDKYKAYIVPAKIMALTVYHLLKDGASEALEILKNFNPVLTKDEYISFKEGKI